MAEQRRRIRIHHLQDMHRRGEPITMLTCYDALTARIFDEAGIDMLLVGDSYANTMLGYDSTTPATLADMVRATGAVARGAEHSFIIGDLPFGCYEVSPQQAVASAVELVKAGAHAVKLEGGRRQAATVRAIVEAGITVIGHIGYTPQSEASLGGPRVQGRDDAGDNLIADAIALEEAGASMVVLELMPRNIADKITRRISIPTIGIGAGRACDGQVLVWADMAGMNSWVPSFVKVYANLGEQLREAARTYRDEVKAHAFPDSEHSFKN